MRPINYIAIHHSLTKDSGTVSWNAIRRYHKTNPNYKFRDIGYHFGIELVGNAYEILTGRMMTEVGAHVRGHNSDTIGICFIGNFDEHEPSKAQWNKGIKLVASLCEVFSLNAYNVIGHYNFDSHKSCPGHMFEMTKFREEIAANLSKATW